MKTLNILLRFIAIRIIYIIIAGVLIAGAYLCLLPEFKIGPYLFMNPLYPYLNGMPSWLYIVDYMIFIFIVSIIIIFGWTLKYSINKYGNKKSDKYFEDIFLPKLFDYLFQKEELSESDKIKQLKELKLILKNDHQRRSLINTLRTLYSQTDGVINTRVNEVLNLMKFDYLIKAYLISPYIKDKIFSLKAISVFGLKGYEKKIVKLTNSKNFILRSEAVITMIFLHQNNNPLLFIFNDEFKPTLWDLNVIVKTIKELKIKLIDYKKLIESENPILIALGIILAKNNNQFAYKTLIQKNINNPSSSVTEEAFLYLIKFAETNEDYNFLMDNYIFATENIQIDIIENLINYENTDQVIRFLKWVVENRSTRQKVSALHMLLEIDISSLLEYKNSENESIRNSCLQTLDINL